MENQKKYRKRLLQTIINKILSEEFANEQTDPNKLYMLHEPVRREYRASKETGGPERPGVMKSWEIGA
jgi:hypothetical protein